MNKIVAILILLCVTEALIIGLLLNEMRAVPEPAPDVPIEEITQDSLTRDSIYIVNDSIRTEIVYIKEKYKKDSVDIMSATDSMLLDSFTKYIEDYNRK